MASTSTVFNPKEHCPWLAMLSGTYGTMGDLGDGALMDIGRDDHGIDFKLYGATASNYLQWDQSEDELVLYAATFGENDNILDIDVYPSSVSACSRQGAISLTMRRDTVMTSWDGNADTAFRVYSYNYAANSTARCRIQAMEILARNRTGSCYSVTGGYITAENYTGSAGVADVTGFEIHAKNNGVASGNVKVLRVYDESQSYTGTTYGIEITNTSASAFAREYCIYIDSGTGSSWTNGITFDGTVTNVFDFAESDGTNGATRSTSYATLTDLDGKIQIDMGGNTLYIPCYASIT